MKQLNSFFRAGSILILAICLAHSTMAAVKIIKCGDPNGVNTDATLEGSEVPATSDSAALQEWGQRLAQQAVLDGKVKCSNNCQKDALPGSCVIKFVSFGSTPPKPKKVNDSTYAFPKSYMTFKVTCTNCKYPRAAIAGIVDPANGTLASCDGALNTVVLSMPGISIYDVSGVFITIDMARERWLGLIIQDNGNDISSSVPWGCMRAVCIEEGYEGGCNMSIDQTFNPPVAEPMFDEETNGWSFAPVEYELTYSCSACGEGGGDNNDDATQSRLRRPEIATDQEEAAGMIEKLYPNPANDAINLMINPKEQNARISITDISGKVVKVFDVSAKAGKSLINVGVSDLPGGIYQLSVTAGSQVATRKFTVNR